MTPTRVLVITPDFPPGPGGIQVVAHKLVTHFVNATTRVLTLDVAGARPWDAAHHLDVRRVAVGHHHRLDVARLNAASVAAARRFAPDVVLAMHIVAGPAAAAIRRILATPIVTYLHAKEVAASPRLARLAVRHSDRVVAVSHHTVDLAKRIGADVTRVKVVPPGVDWREPPRLRRLTTPTVVTVGRMEDRYKGHDVMVRAMGQVRSRIPTAQWLIVGEGALRGEIERLAAAVGVSAGVRMCGAVTDEERDHWLNRAHVFAMPSRVPVGGGGDGFGIVYLEAGVHGLPVVAGHVGGALDAVVDGTTGLLVDPTDHLAVADAITWLLLDPRAAVRIGAAGSEHARAFDWPKIAGRVEDLLVETIAPARPRPLQHRGPDSSSRMAHTSRAA